MNLNEAMGLVTGPKNKDERIAVDCVCSALKDRMALEATAIRMGAIISRIEGEKIIQDMRNNKAFCSLFKGSALGSK